MSKELLYEIRQNVRAALTQINYESSQINKVLQVGGGCQMPMIKDILQQLFPNSEQCCEKHPEEVAAVGAAYYSYYLNLPQKKPFLSQPFYNRNYNSFFNNCRQFKFQ